MSDFNLRPGDLVEWSTVARPLRIEPMLFSVNREITGATISTNFVGTVLAVMHDRHTSGTSMVLVLVSDGCHPVIGLVTAWVLTKTG